MKRQDFNQMMKDSFGDRVTNIPSKTVVKYIDEQLLIAEFMETYIVPDNQLIAEFMELETEIFSGILHYYHREYDSGSWYKLDELSYNDSWDWLMPVIEKIGTHTLSSTIEMLAEYYYKDGDNQDGLEGIEEFHKAVVFYIKNNNLKNI